MIPELRPGDCLLYFSRHSLMDWCVAIKTWNLVSHVEIYRGEGMSVASRNGIGVNLYNLRRDGLAYVLRPREDSGPLDVTKSQSWFFRTAQGQGYDWLGLLCFTLAVHQGAPDKMFCSEFATRWYRAGGFRPFAEAYDADLVAPAQFLQSPAFEPVWKSRG